VPTSSGRDHAYRALGRRRHRAQQEQQRDGGQEGEHVHGVGGPHAGHGDEHPADGRTRDRPDLPAHALHGVGRGLLVARHEPRRHRVQRGPLQPVERGHGPGDDVQRPDRRMRQERVEQQRAGGQRHAGLTPQDHPPPVGRVGDRAAPQPAEHHRHQLHDADDPDRDVGAGELFELERHGHDGDEAAEHGDHAAGHQQAEVPVLQRSDVHAHMPQPLQHDSPTVFWTDRSVAIPERPGIRISGMITV
jgi:hypothetical protein